MDGHLEVGKGGSPRSRFAHNKLIIEGWMTANLERGEPPFPTCEFPFVA